MAVQTSWYGIALLYVSEINNFSELHSVSTVSISRHITSVLFQQLCKRVNKLDDSFVSIGDQIILCA